MNTRPTLPEKSITLGLRAHAQMITRVVAILGLPLGAGCGWVSLIGDISKHDAGPPELDAAATPSDAGDVAEDVPSQPPTPSAIPDAHAVLTGGAKLDLLFMIDDSSSMAPLQQKLAQRLGDFMNILKALPGGLPNIHVAAVSSSLGAGAYGNVPGCSPGSTGNLNGAFLHPSSCDTFLAPGQNFLAHDGITSNYSGDITDAFSCLTQAGQGGCGFEHQFESIRLALQRAQNPMDPNNSGFLRPDAFLGIVMLTNEDDCSVPASSLLFDPSQQTLADPLGGLQSYRCNEFGHLCDGMKPPHNPPAVPQTFSNCTSSEDGVLVTVEGFATFLKSLKADPSRIFVAALAGAPTPYVVTGHTLLLGNGITETQPQIQHSCSSSSGDYADPGVRIAQLLRSFGPNAVFESICSDDFMPAMRNIGNGMVGMMAP